MRKRRSEFTNCCPIKMSNGGSGEGEICRIDDQQQYFRDSEGPWPSYCYCWTLRGSTYRVGEFTQSTLFQDEIQNQWRIKFYQGELRDGRVHNAAFELILVVLSPSSSPRPVKAKVAVVLSREQQMSVSTRNLNVLQDHQQQQVALGNNHQLRSSIQGSRIFIEHKDDPLVNVSSEFKLTASGTWVKGTLPERSLTLLEKGVLKFYFQIHTMRPLKIVTAESTQSPVAFSIVQNLFMDAKFADVLLCSGGISFPAHRNILAARSPYFEAQFISEVAGNWKNMLEISGFPEPVVRGMLEFIYTDKTSISQEFASDWFRISDMFGLDGLRAQAEIALGANLTVDNVIRLFDVAVSHKAAKLKAGVLQFIKMNLKAVKKSAGMKELALKSPDAMFELFMELTQD